MILAGDIGGTKSELGLFRRKATGLECIETSVFPSQEHAGLDEIVRKFTAGKSEPITAACFGIAGPVQGDVVETPNLPWKVEGSRIAGFLGLPKVTLLNDLEANAYGISALQPEDLVPLTNGTVGDEGNAALISAGTGLGEAGLHWNGMGWEPIPSEGGHVDFAPRNRLEVEMLAYMLHRFEHVSYERFLSGPGLVNIYQFLLDTERGEEPEWLRDKLDEKDCGSVISQAADQGVDVCRQALRIFVSIYGAAAGNLALKVMAVNGVYVGGGIAPKILPHLQSSVFLEAFRSKGRMRTLMEKIPVRVIMNPKTALIGAAHVALQPGDRTIEDPLDAAAGTG
jgi:glucokinase